MEEKSIPISPPTVAATGNNHKPTTTNDGNKKNRNAFSLLKALLMFRQRPNRKSKKPVQVEAAANGNWKKIVGSMRPLHLQEDNPSPPSTPEKPAAVLQLPEQAEYVLQAASPSHSTSSAGTMSQYASANNLQELDKHDGNDDDDDDSDKFFDGVAGDVMIDAKAEEFIAQFYKQMRLQRNRRITKGKGLQ